MTYLLRISNLAEQDIATAKLWYQKENSELVHRFSLHLEETFSRIAETPLIYACIFDDMRRAVMHHFPYGIFYQIESNDIHIKAVLHDHRDPSTWQKRLT